MTKQKNSKQNTNRDGSGRNLKPVPSTLFCAQNCRDRSEPKNGDMSDLKNGDGSEAKFGDKSDLDFGNVPGFREPGRLRHTVRGTP